jgi:hypothetical protein
MASLSATAGHHIGSLSTRRIKPVSPTSFGGAARLPKAHPRAAWPCHVQAVLQDALDVRDRVAAGEISAHGAAVARGHLMTRLLDLLAAPGTVPDCQRLAAHLTTELPAVFGFLFDFTLDATNWRAEQALRPAVVNRKVSGGNRSSRGAETQEILTSVIQTARLRHLDLVACSWICSDPLNQRFHRRSPSRNKLIPLTSYTLRLRSAHWNAALQSSWVCPSFC